MLFVGSACGGSLPLPSAGAGTVIRGEGAAAVVVVAVVVVVVVVVVVGGVYTSVGAVLPVPSVTG